MNITLPEEDLNQILGKVILETLTQEARDTIIAEAIAHLNKPQGDSWRKDRTTPLQDAFHNALMGLTTKLVREIIEDELWPEVKEQVTEMLKVIPEHAQLSAESKTNIMTTIFEELARGRA